MQDESRTRLIAGVIAVIVIAIASTLVYRDFRSAKTVNKQAEKQEQLPFGQEKEMESGNVTQFGMFEESMCGFSILNKFDGWSIDYTKGGGVSVVSGVKEVIIACQEEIPGIPLPEEKIEKVVIDGAEGKLYHDASPRDGTSEDDIRVRHPYKEVDVTIRGTPGFVKEVGATLKWMR